MAWRERLRKGTFRGVPFNYENIELTGGRGVVVHNFAAGGHSTEDMKRKERNFDLSIYVIGPNYMIERDALVSAFEAPGAGQLVIPTGGGGRYRVDSFTSSEHREAGGMCRFDVTFIEAGNAALSLPIADTAAGIATAVVDAATAAITSARSSLRI